MPETFSSYKVDRSTVADSGPFTELTTSTDKTTTTAAFVVPAIGSSVTVPVADSSWVVSGDCVNVPGAGFFEVDGAPPDGTSMRLKYSDLPTNISAGETIISGEQVIPGSYRAAAPTSGTVWDRVTVTTSARDIVYNVTSMRAQDQQPGLAQWAKRFGTPEYNEKFTAIAIDRRAGNGDIIACGDYQGNHPLLARFSPSGDIRWFLSFQRTGTGNAYSVAVDSSGNSIVVGKFTGMINMAGTEGVDHFITATSTYSDMFMAKYDANGVYQWAFKFGGSVGDTSPTSVAVDSTGRIIVVGGFYSVNFGNGVMTSASAQAIFLAKFESTGAVYSGWVPKQFGGSVLDIANGVAVDSSDNIAMTGGFFGTDVTFGGDSFTTSGGDVFIAKFNGTSGAHQWSKHFSNPITQYGTGITFDATGNVIVIGVAQNDGSNVAFGGVNHLGKGYEDVFVVKLLGASGGYMWDQYFGDWFSDTPRAVAADSSDNVYVVGDFLGTVTCGIGATPISSTVSLDCFIVKYSTGGSHTWSKSFGGGAIERAHAVAVGLDGKVIVGGLFFKPIDLGNGVTLESTGNNDAFLIAFAP